jgi:hypothetical protein
VLYKRIERFAPAIDSVPVMRLREQFKLVHAPSL